MNIQVNDIEYLLKKKIITLKWSDSCFNGIAGVTGSFALFFLVGVAGIVSIVVTNSRMMLVFLRFGLITKSVDAKRSLFLQEIYICINGTTLRDQETLKYYVYMYNLRVYSKLPTNWYSNEVKLYKLKSPLITIIVPFCWWW